MVYYCLLSIFLVVRVIEKRLAGGQGGGVDRGRGAKITISSGRLCQISAVSCRPRRYI